jgi:hypothetical protein
MYGAIARYTQHHKEKKRQNKGIEYTSSSRLVFPSIQNKKNNDLQSLTFISGRRAPNRRSRAAPCTFVDAFVVLSNWSRRHHLMEQQVKFHLLNQTKFHEFVQYTHHEFNPARQPPTPP